MSINEYLTEADIIKINNTISKYDINTKEPQTYKSLKNIDINTNIIKYFNIKVRNLLLIYKYIKDNNEDNYVLIVINIISKDIILYLFSKDKKLIRFINYKDNIDKYYGFNTTIIFYNKKYIYK